MAPPIAPVKPRRRWVPWAAAYASAAATLAIVLLVTAVARAEPIAFIGGGYGVSGPTAVAVPAEFGDGYNVVRFAEGAPFTVKFHMGNAGGYAVKVRDIPVDDSAYSEVTGIRMGPALHRSETPAARMTPFAPFRLEPGKTRWIEIDYRFYDPCPGVSSEDGASLGLARIPVTYRAFGITRHTTFEFPHQIYVVASGESCPASRTR